MKSQGLGRGLDALLAGNGATNREQQRTLPVGHIQPGKYQPRTRMDAASLEELAGSIRVQGLMQPILVRPVGDDRYEIIAGVRRCRAAQMAGLTEVSTALVDFGSGSSVKTEPLLDRLSVPVAYMPLDISRAHLFKTAIRLRKRYPEIEILPIVAHFTQGFRLPRTSRPYAHAAVYFPGSTIGNFTPREARELLERTAKILGRDGGLLIGIDLQKDPAVIEAAYNDAEGLNAEFNLNLLHRINRELNAGIRVEEFRHKAIYNELQGRVEISACQPV